MTDLIDLMQARSERDKAIQKVSLNNNSFMDRAIQQLRYWVDIGNARQMIDEFTGEDMRIWLQAVDIVPAHPNAWGALISTAVKRKIIVGTEKYVSMKSIKSHARKTQLYRWA